MVLLAVPALHSAEPEEGNSLFLARDGKSVASIVMPVNAPVPVYFAATELRYYLERMSGARIDILSRIPPNRVCIVLGEDYAAKADIDVSKLKRDGFVIKTIGNLIYIAGRDDRSQKAKVLLTLPADERLYRYFATVMSFERATLNGVYYLLETLGVRWFFPGPKGEVVPHKRTIAVKPLNVTEEPYAYTRTTWGGIGVDPRYRPHYGRANAQEPMDVAYINHHFSWYCDEARELGWNYREHFLWFLRMRRSTGQRTATGERSLRHWPGRFSKTHPEYFALKPNGARALNTPHLNYTDEGVFRETLADIDAFFSGKPGSTRGIIGGGWKSHHNGWRHAAASGDTFSLTPYRGLVADQSEKSRTFINEDAEPAARHSNYVWQFVARVARVVKKRHPGKYLGFSPRETYLAPPDPKVVEHCLVDNVILGFDGGTVIGTLKQEQYDRYLHNVKRWSEITGAPLAFNITMERSRSPIGPWNPRNDIPSLLPHQLGKVLRNQARYRGRYLTQRIDCNRIMMMNISNYLLYRLMWNPYLEVDDLLDDYCQHLFGPSAPIMRNLLSDIETQCEQIGRTSPGVTHIWTEIFSAKVLGDYRARINEAARLTQNTSHSGAVDLYSRLFIEVMETRQAKFAHIYGMRAKGIDKLVVARVPEGSIDIDARPSEKQWKRCKAYPMYNRCNSKPVDPPATVRLCYDSKMLYCFFDVYNPTLMERLQKKTTQRGKHFVESLFDVNGDQSSFHSVLVFGVKDETVERFFPSSDKPREEWESGVRLARQIRENGFQVEQAIPLKSLGIEVRDGKTTELRGVFCLGRDGGQKDWVTRTVNCRSTSNPLLLGNLHQPRAFGKISMEP